MPQATETAAVPAEQTTVTEPPPSKPAQPRRMPKPLTQTQREQITAALFRREDAKDVAESHGITERQCRRIIQNLKTYGTVNAPRLKKLGRPTCMNKEIEEDLRQFVTAQPLALLTDMQEHVEKKFGVKCSRASLSRRMSEMGFNRGIIRRGFRSADQSVPQLSQVDIDRLLADPSPNGELAELAPNAKKARYAWLLDGQPAGTRKAKKKQPALQEQAEEQIPETLVTPQFPLQQQISPMTHDSFVETYISPYRQVTAEGGLMIRQADETLPQLAAGGMIQAPRQMNMSRRH